MERQSSFGSQSSAGSAFTSRSATTKLVNEAEKVNSVDGQAPGLLTALFGALYTLAKEKINDTASIAMLAIWVDFLFIFTLLLMPEYPWVVDVKSWIFQVFYYIQIHLPIANTGYTFYLAIFYILVAILFISVIICIWVGWCFMNDNFPFLWPIKVARVVVSLFVTMFYIASLNIFLTACTCNKVDGKWKHMYFKLDCLAMPHLIHAAVSLTSGVVFFVVAVLLVLGDHELEPMSRSLLAAPHSMCELRSLLCKTIITIADILLKPLPHVQTVLYTISCGLIFYYHARMVPHYVPWINVMRGGLNAVLAWCALMGCILTFTVHWEWDEKFHPHWDRDEYRQMMTTLMAVGVPVSCLLGAGICWGHLVYAWKAALKFKVLPEGVKPRTIHRFWTEFDVEVASRIGRVWDEEGVLDQTALDIAENVLKAGVAMQPSSVFMHIAYSNFLLEVRHNTQSGWNQLDLATSLLPNLSYQFSIFTRKQEHKQQSGGGGGGGESGAVDLVSYVEFQKNYKSLMVYHKATLVATRDFWRLLTREKIPLDRLGHSFSRMDEMESKAAATYKIVLDRYPSNAKLLRSYAKFLESIKNDPWGAARYYAEAEKQEELEETRAADIQVGEETVSDKDSGILTINATGVIQMANKVATQMLGYKRGELTGKNVSIIMPPPFSTRHNTFLRNYTTTGKAKILDKTREVVALHKDRYVFPCTLKVTRFSGTGVDAMFMGVMKPTETDGTIRTWLLPTGTVLCADEAFMDYAGWSPTELVGKAFSSLAVDNSVLDDLIAQCNTYSTDELDAGALQIATKIRHKYGDSVPVNIRVATGGTDSQRILVLCMKPLEETHPMGAFDQKGQLVYANTPLASVLGYKLNQLKHKNIVHLMPQPYGVLHLNCLKDADRMAAKPPPGSCRGTMTTIMLSSNSTPVYVVPTIIPHPQAATVGGLGLLSDSTGASTHAFKVQRSTKVQFLNERRLMLGVTADGKILWTTSTPDSLFALPTQGLVGQDISSLIDVFAHYHQDDTGADMATALAALLNCATAKPGTSWRVGVGRVTAEDKARAQDAAAAAVLAAAAQKRIVLRQANDHQEAKPAVMTVAPPGDDSLPEDAAAAGADVALFIELWRADLLMAAAEVAEPGCSIVRAESGLGLVLGVDHARLLHHKLNQFLALGPGTQLADLMGTKGPKKGGMKGTKSKSGPVKELNGLHTDGRPMRLSVQAALKDGSLENRLVLAIKPVQALTGAPHMLSELIAAETSDIAPDGAATAIKPVPGLALAQIMEADADAGGALEMQPGTQRSNVPGSNLVTARLVDLDMPDTDDKPHRAPAHLVDSPTGSDEAEHAHKHGHKGVGFHGGDESPTASQQGRDMDVSSGEEEAAASAKHKKKHLTEDEREAMLAAKGANKAREWLELGFGGYKKETDPAEAALALPGAVEDLDGPDLVQAAGSGSGGGAGQGPAEGDQGEKGTTDAGSEATSGLDPGLVSDYGRGKRLRKLMRLLSSKAAMQVVIGFRFKVIILVAAIGIIHMAAFGVLVGFLSKQYTYLAEVEAAGDVLDLVHRTASLSVALEAAQRGHGFAVGSIAKYAAEMEGYYDRMNQLHEGLYLGFSSLRTLEDPRLYNLWHSNSLNATSYLDAADSARSSIQTTSLFALGGMVVSAAKEVQFAALNPNTSESTGPLATLRPYNFLQANGPGTLYGPYIQTLDLMVAQATHNAKAVQQVLLALLCVEGVGFMVAAVITIIRLLRGISVHRLALFSVFLAVPHTFLRTLASKSVSIGVDDGDEDEEDDKVAQAAEEARNKKQKQNAPPSRPDWGSVPGQLQQALDEKKARKGNKKTMFADAGGDAAVHVSVKGPNASGKGTFSMGASGGMTGDPAADRQKLFQGKELVTSTKSAYKLSWPIVLWGGLLLLLYGISYETLNKEYNVMVYTEMMHKSRVAASRVTYLALRANLHPDPAVQADMQTLLADEAKHMQWVYTAALYGTGGLSPMDSAAHGDFEESTGSLFSAAEHKHLLFDTDACLRFDTSTCLDKTSPFYQVTRHGLDALVLRLSEEAKVMTRSNVTVLGPNNPGYQFVYNAAWYDLHDGFSQILSQFLEENKALFNTQRALHIVLIFVMVIGGAAFLLMMLRPFLRHISKESRRCAELLVQLPPDFDVEGMVAATWGVVKHERLMVERSGRTFFETGGVMGTLRELSKSFLGPRPPLQEGMRLSAMAPEADEGKLLFTPRYAAGGRGGPSSSPNDRGSPRRRAPSQEAFFEDMEGEEGSGAAAREGGRAGLRHRAGHGPGPASMGPAGRGGAAGGGGRGAPRPAHSRRAVVPVVDDML